jgi:hypothetical protein
VIGFGTCWWTKNKQKRKFGDAQQPQPTKNLHKEEREEKARGKELHNTNNEDIMILLLYHEIMTTMTMTRMLADYDDKGMATKERRLNAPMILGLCEDEGVGVVYYDIRHRDSNSWSNNCHCIIQHTSCNQDVRDCGDDQGE